MKKLISLYLLVYLAACSENKSIRRDLIGKPMPSIRILLLDSSSHFDTKNIQEGQWSVFFYFSSECPYCRAQMKEMTDKINQIKNARIYAVTFGSFNDLKSFSTEFNLNKYSNIITGLDYSNSLVRFFNLKTVPFTAIYNPKNKIIWTSSGKTSVNQIKNEIESVETN